MAQKFHVPTPQIFWPSEMDSPVVKFGQFLQSLEDYFVLTDANQTEGNELTNQQKNMLLRSFLGGKAVAQLDAHPNGSSYRTASTNYNTYVSTVRELFDRPDNRVRAHFDFDHRAQIPGETISEYLQALRTLQVDCDWDITITFLLSDLYKALVTRRPKLAYYRNETLTLRNSLTLPKMLSLPSKQQGQ